MEIDLSLKLETDEEYEEPKEYAEEAKEAKKEGKHQQNKESFHLQSKDDKEEDERDELYVLQMEMKQMKEENTRLRKLVEQTLQEYRDLEMRFTVTNQSNKKDLHTFLQSQGNGMNVQSLQNINHETLESMSRPRRLDPSPSASEDGDDREGELGLSLGLHTNGNKDEKDDHKDQKNKELEAQSVTSAKKNHNLQRSESNPAGIATHVASPANRKARVSVRARCETATMNDGCQWRKYGQKIAKGNPCPRAYYRCTVAPGCPVRKQVQRCLEDMSILITTYEGTHNHPLPVGATAMASTASSAANNSPFLLLDSSDSLSNGISTYTNQTHLSFLQRPHLIDSSSSSSSNIRSLNPNDPSKGISTSNHYFLSQNGLSWMLERSSCRGGEDKSLSENVRAIASDPKFSVAVAAAINSLIHKENHASTD